MLCLLLAQSLALTGGTVHSMVPGEEPRVATIAIKDGRITAIGPDLEVPEGAEVIDLTGLHLIPGLIDAAVNHDSDHDVLYISSGITLVRDTGNDLARILAEREPSARERNPGPDLFLPGLPLDGDPPATTMSVVMTEVESARNSFGRLLTSVQPDYIHYAEGLPADVWRELRGWAKMAELDVWGPIPHGIGLDEVLGSGQAGLMSLQAALPPGKGWHEIEDRNALDPQIAKLIAAKTAITPMVMVYGRMLKSWDGEVEALHYLGPHYRSGWTSELRVWRERMQGELRGLTERALALEGHVIAKLALGGVSIVPGSGSPNPGLMPGEALLDELLTYVDGGLDSYDVLRMATHGAAEVLGVEEDHGSLSVGKLANVVALGLDPREHIRALRELEVLVLRGKVYERDDLDNRLQSLRDQQAERFRKVNLAVEVPAPEVPEGDLILRGRAETRAEGVRTNSESFAVVKTPTRDTVYSTRIYNQATATTQGNEVTLRQLFRDDRLFEFDMVVLGKGEQYEITGRLLGGLMNVEARANGMHLYGNRAKQPIAFVDIGGAMCSVIAGQKLTTKVDNFVLGFEDLDPVVHRWRLHIAPDDHQFVVDAGVGYAWYGFRATGAPAFTMRQQGTGQTELRLLDIDTLGGPGLALSADRVWTEPKETPVAR